MFAFLFAEVIFCNKPRCNNTYTIYEGHVFLILLYLCLLLWLSVKKAKQEAVPILNTFRRRVVSIL